MNALIDFATKGPNILAIDLGKCKSMACVHPDTTVEIAFITFATAAMLGAFAKPLRTHSLAVRGPACKGGIRVTVEKPHANFVAGSLSR